MQSALWPRVSIERVITREALTLSVNNVFLGYAVLFVLLIPVQWFAKPPFANSGPETMH